MANSLIGLDEVAKENQVLLLADVSEEDFYHSGNECSGLSSMIRVPRPLSGEKR